MCFGSQLTGSLCAQFLRNMFVKPKMTAKWRSKIMRNDAEQIIAALYCRY
jgi:hypothetical protein